MALHIKRHNFWLASIMLLAASFQSLAQTASDLLKLKTGNVIQVKLKEVSTEEISYFRNAEGNGPVFKARLSQVAWIKLATDKDTIFYNVDEPTPVQAAPAKPVPRSIFGLNKRAVAEAEAANGTVAPKQSMSRQLIRFTETDRRELTFGAHMGTYTPITQYVTGLEGFGNVKEYAGQSFLVSLAFGVRFNQSWGAHLTLRGGYGSSDMRETRGQFVNDAGAGEYNAESSNGFGQFGILLGPTYFVPLTNRIDLLLKPSLGVTVSSVPSYSFKPNAFSSNRTVNYDAGTGFWTMVNVGATAQVRTFLQRGYYLSGYLGYDAGFGAATWRYSTQIIGSNSFGTRSGNLNVNGVYVGLGMDFTF